MCTEGLVRKWGIVSLGLGWELGVCIEGLVQKWGIVSLVLGWELGVCTEALGRKWDIVSHFRQSFYYIHCVKPFCLLAKGDMHSFLVAMNAFTNIKPSIANNSNFIYPCQVCTIEATKHKLNPAFKRNVLFFSVPNMRFRKFTTFTAFACCLDAYWLTINHMARSRGTLVPLIIRISYSITFLAIVHM